MTKDEALRMALKAMLNFPEDISDEMFEAITAIKEALANVAINDTSKECVDEMQKQRHDTTSPQRKPLTDEELKPLIQKAMMYYGHNPEHWLVTSGAGFCILARAIEAAHGIKK